MFSNCGFFFLAIAIFSVKSFLNVKLKLFENSKLCDWFRVNYNIVCVKKKKKLILQIKIQLFLFSEDHKNETWYWFLHANGELDFFFSFCVQVQEEINKWVMRLIKFIDLVLTEAKWIEIVFFFPSLLQNYIICSRLTRLKYFILEKKLYRILLNAVATDSCCILCLWRIKNRINK